MDMYDEVVNSKIHALSFFSGCGGLDIGTQLAGVKVISSLDFEPAAIKTISANPFLRIPHINVMILGMLKVLIIIR